MSRNARLTVVWAALSVVTIVSWLLSRSDRSGGRLTSSTVITVAVLAIAFVKAMLILGEFMEVRRSPTWLRRFCAGWLVVLWAAILGIYLA
jgi:Prokaryotic Cytochrome C oxidase subunit IV